MNTKIVKYLCLVLLCTSSLGYAQSSLSTVVKLIAKDPNRQANENYAHFAIYTKVDHYFIVASAVDINWRSKEDWDWYKTNNNLFVYEDALPIIIMNDMKANLDNNTLFKKLYGPVTLGDVNIILSTTTEEEMFELLYNPKVRWRFIHKNDILYLTKDTANKFPYLKEYFPVSTEY